MKKTILALIMTIAAVAAFSQAKYDVSKIKKLKDTVIDVPANPTDTIFIDLSKVRYIRLSTDIAPHDLFKEIPFFLSIQYAYAAYNYFQHAKFPEISKDDIDQLQAPFAPYWQYYQRQLQEQKKK
jgi:hypothetical protein